MNKPTEPLDTPPSLQNEATSTSLRIEYTTTRVVRESAASIRRIPGVVGMGRSPLSEAFKVLRTQLLQRMRANDWSSVAVTSVRPTKSKSIATINLALSIAAELDKTALLIDADLGAPRIDALFGLASHKGLSDYLLENVPLKELILNPGIEHLVVLPAGRAISNSAELLATNASTRLIEELKGRYPQRYIIFDAPSVLTADGLSLFEKVDAVLLVVERNVTTKEDLQECAELLQPFNLIGSVLCEASVERDSVRRRTLHKTSTAVSGVSSE